MFKEIALLSYVNYYVQNQIHDFLRNTKGQDVKISIVFSTAIWTSSFIACNADWPRTFSLSAMAPDAGHESIRRKEGNQLCEQSCADAVDPGRHNYRLLGQRQWNELHGPGRLYKLARLTKSMSSVTKLSIGSDTMATHGLPTPLQPVMRYTP